MEPFFSRYKNELVLVVVLAAQLIALATQINHAPYTPGNAGAVTGEHVESRQISLARYAVVRAVAPFERLFTNIGLGTRHAWGNYIALRGVRKQNQELQSELGQMRLQEMQLLADARQGQRLQALLGFREQFIGKTVVAQVIGSSGSDQSRVVYIDKGSVDGLRTDMAVITPDGIVGKLRDVFPHTAMVLEMNDPTAGAGVVLETTRIRGILRGNSAGQPQVIDVLPDDRIKPGERVLTSGGDMVYPRGLPVGNIVAVGADKMHPPYVAITLKPAADLARLEEVLVITEMNDSADTTINGVEVQRAADAAAQALPSITPPDADAVPGSAVTMKASQALRPDKYTPGLTPPATEMQPGTVTAQPQPMTTPTQPSSSATGGQ